MKKVTILGASLFLAALTLMSCDSKKNKVEELVNQFITAVNNQDKATIYHIYPNAKNVENMTFPKNIQAGDITIEKNDTGYYVANIKNDRQQRLVFKVIDENNISLVESFSVLQLDSAATELAIKTGVPLKQMSDIQLSELFNEEGRYITILNKLYADATNGNLKSGDGAYTASRNYGGSVSITQLIRNAGTVSIKAEEYNVEFYFYSPNGYSPSTKQIESGVDLEPGEGYTYHLTLDGGYVNACYAQDFGWKVSFVYKNTSPITTLLKYVKFTGKEYDAYIEALSTSKDNDDVKDDQSNKKKAIE